MNSAIVEVDKLRREFGDKVALRNISLTIPQGGVFGLVGGNGAGKTTLIKHILGLYRPQSGTVRVMGIDPTADPPAVLKQVGYLSEDRDLPGWMQIQELMSYLRAFYPDWDDRFVGELMEMFDLRPQQLIKSLSRGQLARVGLLAALAHRPKLLLLDEPSSGLDPVVRRDILGAVIRTVADEGRTVIFSSHLLDEVERVADRVAMLHAGAVVLDDTLENLKTERRVLTLRFTIVSANPPMIAGALPLTGEGREWKYLTHEPLERVRRDLQQQSAELIDELPPSLEEIFVGCSGGRT